MAEKNIDIAKLVHEMRNEFDDRLDKIEGDLIQFNHACDINSKLLAQGFDNDRVNTDNKINKLVLSVDKLVSENNENKMFVERLTQTWKVIGIIAMVLSAIGGGIYTVIHDNNIKIETKK